MGITSMYRILSKNGHKIAEIAGGDPSFLISLLIEIRERIDSEAYISESI